MPAPRSHVPPEDAVAVSRSFADLMSSRRTIRDFSTEPVPIAVIRDRRRTAPGRAASRRPGDAHPHAEPDALDQPGARPAARGAAVRPHPYGLPEPGRNRADIARKPLEEVLVLR